MMTITVPDGYSKLKTRPTFTVRDMTLGEAKELRYGHIKFVSTNGELRECKVNGSAKTWKTRPGDVDIPVKYGMYEYAVFSMRNGAWVSETHPVVVVD